MLERALAEWEGKVYQAVLARFHLSPIFNQRITRSYESMSGKLYKIGYHTACAFLDCEQVQIFEQYADSLLSNFTFEASLGKMHQLNDGNLGWIPRKHLEHFYDAPHLSRSLVLRRAPENCIEVVWEAI